MRHIAVGSALIALLCAVAVAEAQQGTADLRGRVVDAQQAAMPGVAVIVRNQESGLFREATSGPDGSFFMAAMLPGMYQVEANLQGFRPFERRDVRLEVGRTATIEVTLQVAGIEESVTVRAEAPLIDTTSTEVGGLINSEEFLDTPTMNRNFNATLGLLPGVVANLGTGTFGSDTINVGGQGTRNNMYSLDGSFNNDEYSGAGYQQVRVPMEAVGEVNVLTGTFDAEFGQASGAIVNAVTKQGTNQFHGSAFTFFQNEKLATADYFVKTRNLTEPKSKQQQFGGTLGGPIIRDKAHFFASLERILFNRGITPIVPGRPDLSTTFFGESATLNIFTRFDHQINAGNTWGVRWLRESSPQPFQYSTSAAQTADNAIAEEDVDQSVVGSLNSVIGSTKVNTFRVAFTHENLLFGNPAWNPTYKAGQPDQKSLPPMLDYANFDTGQNETAYTWNTPSLSIEEVFSWFVPSAAGGQHELKFGASWRRSRFRNEEFTNSNGTFTFGHNLPFNAADPRTYPERFDVRVHDFTKFIRAQYIGAFAQDKWKIGDRLTLNLGVRYDFEVIKTPNQDNPLFAGDADGYPRDMNNVQPRLGFSYALDAQGRSAVRGGFGLMYNTIPLSIPFNTVSTGRFVNSYEALFPLNNIDPGPRNGQFPTDPTLVNGPKVNRALLDALFPPAGTLFQNRGIVWFDNPDRAMPYSRQYSFGYQTQIGTTVGLTLDYLRAESRNQFVLKDLNPPLRATGLATGAVTRTNPLVGAAGEFVQRVNTVVNEGFVDYDSVQVGLSKRFSQSYSARVSYAWSRANGNIPNAGAAGNNNGQLLGDMRLDTEEGPVNTDRPHILSMNGTWEVPRTGGLRLSTVFQARSGTPFSLVNTTFDADRNGLNVTAGNEYIPAGTYSGTGADAITVENKGGRNGARGPNYMSVDFRGGYRFTFGGSRTLDAHVDVFNITDRVNFQNPSGDQRLASFLGLTGTQGATRTAQLNLRFGF